MTATIPDLCKLRIDTEAFTRGLLALSETERRELADRLAGDLGQCPLDLLLAQDVSAARAGDECGQSPVVWSLGGDAKALLTALRAA